MGRTLNLLGHLLSQIRQQLDMDQPRQALRHLRRLTALLDAPGSPSAEIHHLLGDAYLKLGDYGRSRRHLRQCLRIDSTNAESHYLLARAIECDPHCDAGRAGRAYQRALELAPHNARYLADAGAYHVQMGRPQTGTTLLAQAVEIEPEDRELLEMLIDGLCEAGRFDDARRALHLARFRIRATAWFSQLCDEVEFRRARAEQHRVENAVATTAPAVLPYLRVFSDQPLSVRGRKFRRDALSVTRPHLRRFDTGRSG